MMRRSPEFVRDGDLAAAERLRSLGYRPAVAATSGMWWEREEPAQPAALPCAHCGRLPEVEDESPPIPLKVYSASCGCDHETDGETGLSWGHTVADAVASWDEKQLDAGVQAWAGSQAGAP